MNTSKPVDKWRMKWGYFYQLSNPETFIKTRSRKGGSREPWLNASSTTFIPHLVNNKEGKRKPQRGREKNQVSISKSHAPVRKGLGFQEPLVQESRGQLDFPKVQIHFFKQRVNSEARTGGASFSVITSCQKCVIETLQNLFSYFEK